MATRFSGTIEELKAKLASLATVGSWLVVNANQHQFRHHDGGVMNWFPSTGSINFQGKPELRDFLQATVAGLLHATPAPVFNVAIQGAPTKAASAARPPEPKLQVAKVEAPFAPDDTQAPLQNFSDSELIIGLVGAVGTEMSEIISVLEDRLKIVGYTTHKIRVSERVIPKLVEVGDTGVGEADRIKRLMDAGDEARRKSGDNGILASGIAAEIAELRNLHGKNLKRAAFIVNSLKHPDEVLRLRQIYPRGFYLIGVHPDEKVRASYWKRKNVRDEDVDALIERDQDEHLRFGQRVNDTFHLSDFFVRLEEDSRLNLEKSLLAFSIFSSEIHTRRLHSMSLRCSWRSRLLCAQRTFLDRLVRL